MSDDPPTRLPFELLSLIAEFVADGTRGRRTLLPFMLASREFHDVGLPILWRDLDLHGNGNSYPEIIARKMRQVLDTGRRRGALPFVRRVRVQYWNRFTEELGALLAAIAPYLHHVLFLSRFDFSVVARMWELVKDGPNLEAVQIHSYFPAPFEPDGALPKTIKRLDVVMVYQQENDITRAEALLQGIDRSVDLVEWRVESLLVPVRLFEKYCTAASKLRYIEISAWRVDELAKYAHCFPNLETLLTLSGNPRSPGNIWPLLRLFPSLRRFSRWAAGTSELFGPLICDGSQLAGLPRGLKLDIQVDTFDLGSANLDQLAKILNHMKWTVESIDVCVERASDVELAFWKRIARHVRLRVI